MTIICVRDGLLAVDSLVTADSTRCGTARKWGEVHAHRGGGVVAACGLAGWCHGFLRAMAEPTAELERDGDEEAAYWLLPSGELREWSAGHWISIDAPFHAIGSGARFALGAMAHGASAEEAARIACELSTSCGGPVHVLRPV